MLFPNPDAATTANEVIPITSQVKPQSIDEIVKRIKQSQPQTEDKK